LGQSLCHIVHNSKIYSDQSGFDKIDWYLEGRRQ